MTLIYAFCDAAGAWHGDPNTDILETEPGQGSLTMPQPGGPVPSPFAGQRLQVLYAITDLEPSPTTYRLDDGCVFPATWHVHELLTAPYLPATAPAAIPRTSTDATPRALDVDISYGQRRYALTADWNSPGRLEVTVMVSHTDTAEILGELTGDIAATDLERLAELLGCAARACSGQEIPFPSSPPPAAPRRKRNASNTGQPWTGELLQALEQRFYEGADAEDLADEFGRSVGSIRWKLWQMELTEFPSDLVPEQTSIRPAAPKAWTATEKRRAHPNAYKRWSAEDEQRLARRSAEGASLEQLCAEFGRDRGAIDSRLVKIDATGPAADQARSGPV